MKSNVNNIKNNPGINRRGRKFTFTRKKLQWRDYYQSLHPCGICTALCCKTGFSYHGTLCILIILKICACYILTNCFASVLIYQSIIYPSDKWLVNQEKYSIWAAYEMFIHGLYCLNYFFFFYHLRKIKRKSCDIWCYSCWVLPLASIGNSIYAYKYKTFFTETVILYIVELIWLLYELWTWFEVRKEFQSKEPIDLGFRGLLRPKELRVAGIELPIRSGGYDRSTYMEAEKYLLRNNAHLKPIPNIEDTNLYLLKKRAERLKRAARGEDDDDEDFEPGTQLSAWKVGRQGSLVHIRESLYVDRGNLSKSRPSKFRIKRLSSVHPKRARRDTFVSNRKFTVGALQLLETKMDQDNMSGNKRKH